MAVSEVVSEAVLEAETADSAVAEEATAEDSAVWAVASAAVSAADEEEAPVDTKQFLVFLKVLFPSFNLHHLSTYLLPNLFLLFLLLLLAHPTLPALVKDLFLFPPKNNSEEDINKRIP